MNSIIKYSYSYWLCFKYCSTADTWVPAEVFVGGRACPKRPSHGENRSK